MTLDSVSSTLYEAFVRKNPAETEFHQVVYEVLHAIQPVLPQPRTARRGDS